MNLFDKLTQDRLENAKVLNKASLRRIWEQIVDKYSDQAHFIYELLQNADDALATEVSFILNKFGLIFIHNGKIPFDLSDAGTEELDSTNGNLGHINSITSAANTTKAESKIGKFGVGFKAVFQYTHTPHIYDDNFSFRIEQYIVPVFINTDHPLRTPGKTLFYFPFDSEKKKTEDAYKEISEKLKTLNYPVLFLYHLNSIVWETDELKGFYGKELIDHSEKNDTEIEYVKLINSTGSKVINEKVYLFYRQVETENGKISHRIATGYFVDDDGLKTGSNFEAYCFFKTKEKTGLGFIINAPFLLTDSRETIKAAEPWNEILINQLAKLASDALLLLRDFNTDTGKNIITGSFLDVIPTKYSGNYSGYNVNEISFLSFYDSFKETLLSNKILPGTEGKYFIKVKSYWASDPELTEIFSDEQLSTLMENPESGWVFPRRGHKYIYQTNKELAEYITDLVNEVVDPKKIIRRINKEFTESQSDEWLMKFYSYLVERQYLWNDKEKLVQRKPIILNQYRKAVVPFTELDEKCAIFIPPNRKTSYDTVNRAFLSDDKSLEFFKCIGITEPDRKTELYLSLIPPYRRTDYKPDDDTSKLNFLAFFEYYNICPQNEKKEYINTLKNLRFLFSSDAGKIPAPQLMRPENIYLKSDELLNFFDGEKNIYYFDTDYYSELLDENMLNTLEVFLTDIGVKKIPSLTEYFPELTNDVRIKFGLDDLLISMKYWNEQNLRDLYVEGFENAIKSLTPEKSLFIWKWLADYLNSHTNYTNDIFNAVFSYVPKGKRYLYEFKTDSSLKVLLKGSKWIYDKQNVLNKPQGLKPDQLADFYSSGNLLFREVMNFLEIRNEDDELNLNDEQRKAFELGKLLLEQKISKEDLNDIIRIFQMKNTGEIISNSNGNSGSNDTDELDRVLGNIKNEINEKKKSEKKKEDDSDSQINSENNADSDELFKASVNFQKEIDKLKKKVQNDIEEITLRQKLIGELKSVSKYSYRWFMILLHLEHLGSYEFRSGNKSITISFSKVTADKTFPGILIFSNPSRFIPSTVSDAENVNVKIIIPSGPVNINLEVVNATDFMLSAKVTSDISITDDDLNSLISAQININNPVFILEELIKGFRGLSCDHSFNMRDNLTDKIKFIFGPPGTGKTTHLLEKEIIPLMKSEKDLKVLVLTPTNKAADVLCRILIDKSGNDFSYSGWFFRYGITGDTVIENSGILVTRNTEYLRRPKMTIVTTISRFAYDYFTEGAADRTVRLCEEKWDVIIFDEASMIPLVYTLFPLYLHKDAEFIVAGDPFQIQPIVSTEDWKDENIYTLVNLDTFDDSDTVPHKYPVVKLTTQYRSVPAIGDLFSNFTYGGELVHHRSAAEIKTLNIGGLTLKDINIINFPVNGYNNLYKPNFLNGSSYHIYSALFTVELTDYILRFLDPAVHKIKSLGIICPYRAQTDLIRKIVESKNLTEAEGKTKVTVGTIHGFQGDECDLIITVLNPRKCSDPSRIFLNNKNIINVSISRARNNLILVMPAPDADGISQLNLVERLRDMIESMDNDKRMIYFSDEMEKIITGQTGFIEDNVRTDSHQSVNVYMAALKKYEIRYEDTAVDIQVSDNHNGQI